MERIVEIVPEAGLHARPASRFVETVNQYDAEIRVGDASETETVDARSMLAVTGLNLRQGDRVRIVAEGEDAEGALDALEEVLATPVEEEGNGGDEGETEGGD
ncbi:MAG: HPr family phosphocarrier protein [Haloarculaceae archaeon]